MTEDKYELVQIRLQCLAVKGKMPLLLERHVP